MLTSPNTRSSVEGPLPAPVYEARLNDDFAWAMQEGSMHFEGRSAVQETLRRIAERLDGLGIDYVIVGGMALFSHGLRRFTEDVDILVTREGLKQIHQALEGSGYRPPFPHSKNLRDTETGVRIEFLVTGEFPGDGRPKPVAFPEPQSVATERDGIRFLDLPALMDLKLASGMTNPDRLKDLADVQELIRLFQLPPHYTERLNPYVHAKYLELWRAVHGTSRRYILVWNERPLPLEVSSLDDVAAALPEKAATLRALRDDGVTLDAEASRPAQGRLVLVTTDPAVAQKHGLHDEAEYLMDGTGDDPTS